MSEEKRQRGIYCLRDPLTGEVRYIGLTTKAKRRKWCHCSASNNKGRRRVNRWIMSLLDKGLEPVFEMIEETSDLDGRERHWIAHYQASGCDLLNMNAGGHDNEHMLSAPRGNRGKPMDRLHFLKMQMRKGIRYARRVGNPTLEAKCRFALAVSGG
jgi:hypothetical protein